MKKIVQTLLIVFILSITASKTTFATTSDNSSYSVSPIYSEHQTEGVENFFDIRWSPALTDTFYLRITNNSDEDKAYGIEVNKARTNKNGIVDYSDNTPENSASLYKITEMVQVPKEVIILANSSQEVQGTILFPKDSFNGILMAGIHVSEKNKIDAKATISNTVAYNIPLVIRGDNDERPKPEITLNKLTIQNIDGLSVGLSNKGSNLLKEVKFEAKIKDKNGKILKTQKSTIDITPETEFIYPINLDSINKQEAMTLSLKLSHGNKDEWQYTKKIPKQKKDLKVQSTSINKEGKHFLWYAIGLSATILVVIYRYKKRKESRH